MKLRLKTYLLFAALFLGALTAQAQSGGNATGNVDCSVYIPNAFTPNGDDINDRFTIRIGESCQVLEFSLRIFDRWGRLVYASESADPSMAWDGTQEGSNLRDGVYMWNFYAKTLSPNKPEAYAEIVKQQGTVVLIR